jgi:ABC-type phosphate transport system substrate-binding protein
MLSDSPIAMKNLFSIVMLISLAGLLMSFDETSDKPGDAIVVIVNKENPINSLTASEVKLYYLRKIKKRWPGINKNIRPAELKRKNPERDVFYKTILGMIDDEVVQYFMNKQIQNAEPPQDKFFTEAELINFIADEPGAISYVKESSLTPEMMARIKIVYTITL